MQNAGMKMKQKKYFFSDAIDYLGHVITTGQIYIAIKTTNDFRALEYPKKTCEIRLFQELRNVRRQFAANYASVVAPLNKILKKSEPMKFELNDEVQQTLDDLKQMFITSPFLALPGTQAASKWAVFYGREKNSANFGH